EVADEDVVDADLARLLDEPARPQRVHAGRLRLGVQVAGEHHGRAPREPLEHEAGLLELLVAAPVGVYVRDRELAAGAAVAQAGQLGDAGLAAQAGALV